MYRNIFHGEPVNFGGTSKFGYNPDIDTNTDPEDIWSSGGTMHFPTSAGTTAVAYSTTTDGAGTEGALTVAISGLDGNWAPYTETVTLTSGSVNTSTNFIRVNRAWVDTCGTDLTNTGDITVSIGGTEVIDIPAGFGQTVYSGYTVPRHSTGVVNNIWFALDPLATVDARFAFATKENPPTGNAAWRYRHFTAINEANVLSSHSGGFGLVLPPRTDMKSICTLTSANNLTAFAGFDISLYPLPTDVAKQWDNYYSGTSSKPNLRINA